MEYWKVSPRVVVVSGVPPVVQYTPLYKADVLPVLQSSLVPGPRTEYGPTAVPSRSPRPEGGERQDGRLLLTDLVTGVSVFGTRGVGSREGTEWTKTKTNRKTFSFMF